MADLRPFQKLLYVLAPKRFCRCVIAQHGWPDLWNKVKCTWQLQLKLTLVWKQYFFALIINKTKIVFETHKPKHFVGGFMEPW
jgi:hypothetical protein